MCVFCLGFFTNINFFLHSERKAAFFGATCMGVGEWWILLGSGINALARLSSGITEVILLIEVWPRLIYSISFLVNYEHCLGRFNS